MYRWMIYIALDTAVICGGCSDSSDPARDLGTLCGDAQCGDVAVDKGQDILADCVCDDGNTCTDDHCDENGRCTNTLLPDFCLIEGVCHGAGSKDGESCQLCDPSRSTDEWTPIIGGCTIGNSCYERGELDATGCQICDPKRSATSWSPRPDIVCAVESLCYADGEKDKGGCNICNKNGASAEWNPVPFACKIDDVCYQEGDPHPSASCETVICDSSVSSTAWTVSGAECLISGACHEDGERSDDGCQQCIPSQSKTSWSSASHDCQIGGACYLNGDKHPSPTCTSVICDQTASPSVWTVSGDECLIGDICRQAGDRTALGCQACVPALSKTAWSNAPYDCKIGESCYMAGDKHPDFAETWCLECNPAKSATDWAPATTYCQIDGVCYQDNDPYPASGCSSLICDSSASDTSWTVTGSECLIDGKCYASGAVNPAITCATATCDPTQSTTGWTVAGDECVIEDVCYAAGALHPSGCWSCFPSVSKTRWTTLPACSKIVISALNEAHEGNLGGLLGADAKCSTQATSAGFPGNWRAFLSTSTQDLKDLVTGEPASTIPVVNTLGEVMFDNWDSIFSSATWSTTAPDVWTFSGVRVAPNTVSPPWYHARNWTGTSATGFASSNCSDWTSTTTSGIVGDLDLRTLVYYTVQACSTLAAVACVQIP